MIPETSNKPHAIKLSRLSASAILFISAFLSKFSPGQCFTWAAASTKAHRSSTAFAGVKVNYSTQSFARVNYLATENSRCSPTVLRSTYTAQTSHVDATTRKSLSSVSYNQVQLGLDQMYPPDGLDQRNALSRKDGYWSFIYTGDEPPQDLTYGEFDFYFFAELLDRAWLHSTGKEEGHQNYNAADTPAWKDKVIADIGSGTGRLVIGAAALHPHMKLCRGLELLEGIHDDAVEKLEECRDPGQADSHSLRVPSVLTDLELFLLSSQKKNSINRVGSLPLATIQLTQGSFLDPSISLGDIDCAFVFSSCYTSELMQGLSDAIGRQCKVGTIVITTDYKLQLEGTIEPGSYEMEIIEVMEGFNEVTGGQSTAYIHRVIKSC
mmetsp:Transcript_23349/g.34309  ORF Transcript_23349/g.34309 Transcript_23349/m.34309 type:complete len:380 (-) Transcript_23349:1251-2390(-)